MNVEQRLSALVINYDSGAFCVRCVESLVADWTRDGRPRELLHVVVVDNASPSDQEPFLQALEKLGATVVRSDVNDGYSGGVNRAYAATKGIPSDAVAILNPDLYFLPGSVTALLGELARDPSVGLVDPRACIDPLGVLNLPRNLMPTPRDQVGVTLARLHPWLSRRYSDRRLKKAVPWLLAEGPLDSDMLSGCCLFTRREVLDRLEGPMDTSFPLYFEDTDLFRRVTKLGYKLVHHGGARILHHWSRSAGVGDAYLGDPHARHGRSMRRYFEKYYGGLGKLTLALCAQLERAWPPTKVNRPMHTLKDLGTFAEPVEIALPRSTRFMVEISMDATFISCVGVLGEGERWVCPQEAWNWFFQAPYFSRAIDLETGDVLGAWTYAKSTPGRLHPLEHHELAEYGERVFGGRAV